MESPLLGWHHTCAMKLSPQNNQVEVTREAASDLSLRAQGDNQLAPRSLLADDRLPKAASHTSGPKLSQPGERGRSAHDFADGAVSSDSKQ